MCEEGGGMQQLKCTQDKRCIERGMVHKVQNIEEQKVQEMCAG
jgi:hypothetical protein